MAVSWRLASPPQATSTRRSQRSPMASSCTPSTRANLYGGSCAQSMRNLLAGAPQIKSATGCMSNERRHLSTEEAGGGTSSISMTISAGSQRICARWRDVMTPQPKPKFRRRPLPRARAGRRRRRSLARRASRPPLRLAGGRGRWRASRSPASWAWARSLMGPLGPKYRGPNGPGQPKLADTSSQPAQPASQLASHPTHGAGCVEGHIARA